MGNFFQKSIKQREVLQEFTKNMMPRTIITRWNYNERLISYVLDNITGLKNSFEKIISDKKNFKFRTIQKATFF